MKPLFFKKEEHHVSREAVKNAVQRFLKKGGKIKQLPEQKHPSLRMIGGDRWNAYEPINSLALV